MIVTGSLIATKPLKEFFTSLKLYYVSLQKLIVLPILICVLMSLMRFDAETVLFCTALAAIPSASTTSMLGELYNISPGYASQAVGLTSLLSLATMPVVLGFAQRIIEMIL